MSEAGSEHPVIPAGWYTDPADAARRRWWNGVTWTNDIQDAAAPTAPVFGGPATLARTPDAYVPFSSSAGIPKATIDTGVAYTRWVWWICGYPLWGVASQIVLIGYLASMSGKPPIVASLVLWILALNLALWGMLLWMAFRDRAGLRAGGNATAGSPWWMLLSPLAYLIARAIEIQRYEVGGWAPLIWYVIASVVAPVVALLGIFAAVGALTF